MIRHVTPMFLATAVAPALIFVVLATLHSRFGYTLHAGLQSTDNIKVTGAPLCISAVPTYLTKYGR